MSTFVIAPHPDDETLGAGGALLRAIQSGEDVHWLIVTEMREDLGFSTSAIKKRESEITAVSKAYGFASTIKLGLPATRLDTLPLNDIINPIGSAILDVQPDTVYLPFPGDVHSDHRVVFDAAAACTKSFRYPSVKKIVAMEILSETDFGIDPTQDAFRPNLFVDISAVLDEKIRIMNLFGSEMGEPPFPRSEQNIRALSSWRGSQAGIQAAEAFTVLKEIC
jgi:LmbE family N-acetylglucosaminyl deacetylase